MSSVRARTSFTAMLLALLVCAGALSHAQTAGRPIRLTSWAVSMANVATGANAVVDIRVDKWSTPQEREKLIATFLDKGQDGLLSALQKVPVKGRISIPGRQGPDPAQTRLGWDLRFAMETPGEDGGKRILIATDRYMTFEEVRNQPRTVDYPFTFIDIRLNKNGEGEGKMAVATQLSFDKKKNTIVFENYSTEPVRLTNVKTTSKDK
jgi:hypothetical protein